MVHLLFAFDPFTIHHCASTPIQTRGLLPIDSLLCKSMDFRICFYYCLVHLWCNSWAQYEIQLYPYVHLSIWRYASWSQEIHWFWDSLKSFPTRTSRSRDFFGRNLPALDLLIHRSCWNNLAHRINGWKIDSLLKRQYPILTTPTYYCGIGQTARSNCQQI